MKAVLELLNAKSDRKKGSHRVEHVTLNGRSSRRFVYHWTSIVTVDEDGKFFSTNNGGYDTMSTNRAINAYRRELLSRGYTEITL